MPLHRAAVELDEVAAQREADAESAVPAPLAHLGLPEALEQVGEEVGSMPWPVSVTTASSWPACLRMRSDTRPSSGVNLIAFDSRFHSTCWKRPQSNTASPRSAATSSSTVTPFACALGAIT